MGRRRNNNNDKDDVDDKRNGTQSTFPPYSDHSDDDDDEEEEFDSSDEDDDDDWSNASDSIARGDDDDDEEEEDSDSTFDDHDEDDEETGNGIGSDRFHDETINESQNTNREGFSSTNTGLFGQQQEQSKSNNNLHDLDGGKEVKASGRGRWGLITCCGQRRNPRGSSSSKCSQLGTCYHRYPRTFKIMVVTLIVLILAIAIGVPLANNNSNNNMSYQPICPDGSTASNCEEPFVPTNYGPDYERRRSKLQRYFPNHLIPVSELQEDALVWLTFQDPDRQNYKKIPDDQYLERYVLAILHNATDGKSWLRMGDFLSDKPVCEWASTNRNVQIECNDETNRLSHLTVTTGSTASLHGTLPTELGLLTDLTALGVQLSQSLRGPLPSEIGRLTNLKSLIFEDSRLSGTIPTEWYQLTKLTTLNLALNQRVNGPLPSELGLMTNLESLWLNDNLLIGTIPSQFGQLTNLYELWLQNNALIGTIPRPIYEDLKFAYSIRVENNPGITDCPSDQENVKCTTATGGDGDSAGTGTGTADSESSDNSDGTTTSPTTQPGGR